MKKLLIFFAIVLSYIILFWLNRTYILPETKLMELLSENYSNELVDSYINYQNRWKWLNYLLTPIVYGTKILLVAFCLNFIKLLDLPGLDNIKFSDLVLLALIGESVFIIAGFYKFANFYWIDTDYSMETLQTYYPISLLNLRNSISTEKWLAYPLQLVNLFELFYWGILAWGIRELSDNKISYFKSFGLVALTYGVGLLFWVGLVSFFILNAQY